jgi:ABC-type nitrate/sulfonate/bicarbonate transport system substrate-binding protein
VILIAIIAAAAVILGTVYVITNPPNTQLSISQDSIVLAIPGKASAFAVFNIAEKEGIFKKHDVNFNYTVMRSTDTSVSALISKDIDLLLTGGFEVMNAKIAGADLAIIATPYTLSPYKLIASSEIKNLDDLRGKTGGVNSVGASPDYQTLEMYLEGNGMDINKDVRLLSLGFSRLPALTSHEVDFILEGAPENIIAEQQGFNILEDFSKLDYIRIPQGIFAVERSILAEKENILVRFLESYEEALLWAKDNKQGALKYMAEWSETDDPIILEDGYQRMLTVNLPLQVDTGVINNTLTFIKERNPSAASFNSSSFVDTRVVDKVATPDSG